MGRGALRGRNRRGRAVITLAGVVLSAGLVACTPVGAGDLASPSSSPDTRGEPSPVPTSTLRPEIRSGAIPAPASAPLAPERVRIPDLDIDMPITDVGVEDSGQMELPVDPAVAGWYRYGPDADSDEGHVMLAAHVDAVGYPIGPLARLRDVSEGASIQVEAADGSTREYVVDSLTYYEKSDLPTGELFARDGDPALVIITCGGPFDSASGHYRDNVVAVAIPR